MGERGDSNTMVWVRELLKDYKTIITDHYWQTETGYPITGIMLGDEIENKPNPSHITLGSAGLPMPGMMLDIKPQKDEDEPLPSDEDDGQDEGELVLKLPLPPGIRWSL